jgi:hypothetical protein
MPAPLPPGAAPAGAELAIEAWNMLGGLDWSGLEMVADILGIDDIELLIGQLMAIRDFQAKKP